MENHKETSQKVDSFHNSLDKIIKSENSISSDFSPNNSLFIQSIHINKDKDEKDSSFININSKKDKKNNTSPNLNCKDGNSFSKLLSPSFIKMKKNFSQQILSVNQLGYKVDYSQKFELQMSHIALLDKNKSDFQQENSVAGNNLKESDKINKKYIINFDELYHLLVKTFLNQELTVDDFKIKKELLFVYNCMLQRKHKKKLRLQDFNLPPLELVNLVNKIIKRKCLKRPEECYKFVFSKTIKFLKLKCKKEKRDFYEFYFSETAFLKNIHIFYYYYPFKKIDGKHGTFSKEFFQRIFEITKFKEDFVKYLKEDFNKNYKIEIENKISRILKNWKTKSLHYKKNADSMDFLKNYIVKNSKSKFPWNLNESIFALEKVSYRISSISSEF
jgi:hypothetical protein